MTNNIIEHLQNLPIRMLSSREASAILGCHQETLYQWVKRGSIHHIRVGGRLKFAPSHLLEYLNSRSIGQGELL